MPQIPSTRPALPGLASSVLAASLWLLPGAGFAFAVRDVPNPHESNGGWVSDVAGILRQDTETSINGKIDSLQRYDGSEMMVVTVPDTSGSSSPKTFATELFNTFKIGKRGIDNGVLMLISKSDRRVEIEIGYGMEERLPDARIGAIISMAMLPRFKEGDFDGGTLAGVGDVIGSLSPEARKNLSVAGEEKLELGEWLDENKVWVIFFLVWLGAFLVHGYRHGFRHAICDLFTRGDSSSSRSDSSSSSSDSSGGGSSGGGGAGGSW
jgi:uncharacterized membrane protein YgcG